MQSYSKMALRMAMLAAALVPAMAMAADFNGLWVRDNARSKAAPYPNYWITRSPPAPGNANAVYVMKIDQTATSVKVTNPLHPQRTYMLDGKSHITQADSGLAKVTTTAAMAGETLSIASVTPYGGMPGNVPIKASETWALSADGKELTITTVRELPAEKQSFTEVFKRL